jgi:hypothetical protein
MEISTVLFMFAAIYALAALWHDRFPGRRSDPAWQVAAVPATAGAAAGRSIGTERCTAPTCRWA